jgi:MscS family membrane protein
MVFLLVLLAWRIWAADQSSTNTPAPAPSTNQPSALVKSVEHLEEHYMTFGLDRVAPLRDYKLFGEPLWKYLAFLVYILLAFYFSKLIDFVTRTWLKRFTRHTETQIDDLLLDLLHGPLKIVVFVVLLNIGLNIFDWSEKTQAFLSKGLILVVAGALTYLTIKVLNLLLDIWKRRSVPEGDRKFDEQLFSVIRKSVNIFVIVVATLVTAQNMGINITAAITSLSIGGLAVGLAAQDTLANLFGAVAVFMDKPFRVGDQIKLDGAEGTVESVGLRSTRVRNPEGHLQAVPNKTMGNAIITNITQRGSIRTVLNFAFPQTLPSAKLKRALSILKEVYAGNPMTQDVSIGFSQFTGPNMVVQVQHRWKGTDSQKCLVGMQDMNLAVKERFEAEGITLADKP